MGAKTPLAFTGFSSFYVREISGALPAENDAGLGRG
jgi:hypothetical protein